MKRLFLVLSLVFAPMAPVFAAAASTPNNYDVEVIVFQYQMLQLRLPVRR